MVMALGVPIGAFAGAWRAGEFRWKLPAGWSLLKIFAGGLLMGGSALLAEGCNINQGLTNSATLAVGSLLTFASMGAGAWLALWALFLRDRKSTRLNSSHRTISYAVFCLKKKKI